MSLHRILVIGATGKQGGALIKALLQKSDQPFEIYALTRNRTSLSAQKLQSQPQVKVIEGDLDDIPAIFAQIPSPVWGLFSVPILDKGVVKEVKQGKELVDAAVNAGVSHLVLTTTDRGGPVHSENNPTSVPHFASKFKIEEHIKNAQSADGNFTYTFLRPVAFFENVNPEFFGKVFIAVWKLNGLDNKLQFVATSDIGRVGAEAFLQADQPKYRNKAISLAGDELDVTEFAKIFKDQTGQELPETFSFLGWAIRQAVKDLRMMAAWFKSDGFGADIPALRKDYPFIMDTRTWLLTDSAWKKK